MKPHQFRSSEIAEEGPSLSPEFIAQVLGEQPRGAVAVVNAQYGAQLLEEDRAATEIETLRREVATWRKAFPKYAYHAGQLVPVCDADAWGPR